MLREKWTWLALGLVATIGLLMLNMIKTAEISGRVSKLERFMPYLEPRAN